MRATVDHAKQQEEQAEAAKCEEYAAFLERADAAVEELYVKAQEQQESMYVQACKLYAEAQLPGDYRTAIDKLKLLGKYKDSEELVRKAAAEKQLAEDAIREKQEAEAKAADEKTRKAKNRKRLIISSVIVLAVAFLFVYSRIIVPGKPYRNAVKLYESGQYTEAYEAFLALESTDKALTIIKQLIPVIPPPCFISEKCILTETWYRRTIPKRLSGFPKQQIQVISVRCSP